MPPPIKDSIVPPMDARDMLKVQRRTAFLEMIQIFESSELGDNSALDECLDRFFKSGIELERRHRHNG
jgi:hypothetical protein